VFPRFKSRSSDLILRSIAQAMRLEGWRRTLVQAAILRDARIGGATAPPESALLRMRSARVDPEGLMESIRWCRRSSRRDRPSNVDRSISRTGGFEGAGSC
jgi:hypothetical protein